MSFSEPEGTRTPNLHGRNVVHYPIMLQVRFAVIENRFSQMRCKYRQLKSVIASL